MRCSLNYVHQPHQWLGKVKQTNEIDLDKCVCSGPRCHRPSQTSSIQLEVPPGAVKHGAQLIALQVVWWEWMEPDLIHPRPWIHVFSDVLHAGFFPSLLITNSFRPWMTNGSCPTLFCLTQPRRFPSPSYMTERTSSITIRFSARGLPDSHDRSHVRIVWVPWTGPGIEKGDLTRVERAFDDSTSYSAGALQPWGQRVCEHKSSASEDGSYLGSVENRPP